MSTRCDAAHKHTLVERGALRVSPGVSGCFSFFLPLPSSFFALFFFSSSFFCEQATINDRHDKSEYADLSALLSRSLLGGDGLLQSKTQCQLQLTETTSSLLLRGLYPCVPSLPNHSKRTDTNTTTLDRDTQCNQQAQLRDFTSSRRF